ncbi:MAG: hypothetical protein KDK39_09155 [Leptospiraceae bacterium]|nr:hypothetical protein [Leptospiraceae bacterium]
MAEQDPEKIPFLKLITEAEVQAAGFNLTERNHFTVFQTIKKNSSSRTARARQLFEPDIAGTGLGLDRVTMGRVLKNLISIKAIVQLFYFEYKKVEGQSALWLHPVFASLPEDPADSIESIYKACIASSLEAIEQFFLAHPIRSYQEVWQDLLDDWQKLTAREQSKTNSASTLPTPRAGVLQIETFIRPGHFDLMANTEMLKDAVQRIYTSAAADERVLHLPDTGLIFCRREGLIERFKAAEDFMLEKIIPASLKNTELKAGLGVIAEEEAVYYIDPNKAHLTDFSVRKAKLLNEHLCANSVLAREPLALQLIIALGTLVDLEFRRQWQSIMEQQLNAVRGPLLNTDEHWFHQVLFISRSDFQKWPPPVRDGLFSDPGLFYTVWQRRYGSWYLFLRRDRELVETLVSEMVHLPPADYWKVLALRELIDANDEFFKSLFSDRQFKRAYGRMLRLVYIDHIPFYLKIFMYFGFQLFQNQSFQIAKQNIRDRQKQLELRNLEAFNQQTRAAEFQRLQQIDQIRSVGKFRKILDLLETEYFTKKNVPIVSELQTRASEYGIEDFVDFVKQYRFQVIKFSNFDRAGQSILCFPLDADWPLREHRLLELISAELKRLQPAAQTIDPAAQPEIMRRLLRLQKYMDRLAKSQKANAPGSDDDPYLRLEREIRKQKAQEQETNGEVLEV